MKATRDVIIPTATRLPTTAVRRDRLATSDSLEDGLVEDGVEPYTSKRSVRVGRDSSRNSRWQEVRTVVGGS